MPENKQIHDLPIAEQTSSSDLFETEIPSQLMQSGFASRKVSAAEIADLLLNDMTYPQALQTTAKKIIPAINEAAQSGGGGGASVVQKTMAEYTALPTADKMNGSIYKITDKALIYCLDEEYHALKEITSADYALLTSDEKNNGTLYVLTDEETTAADIPYSAGVSVADMLDVEDLSSQVTLRSGYDIASWGNLILIKYGHLCHLSFSGVGATNAITSDTPIIDLPVTAKFFSTGFAFQRSSAVNRGINLFIDPNTTQIKCNSFETASYAYGCITFFV